MARRYDEAHRIAGIKPAKNGHGPERKADATPSFNLTDQGNAERLVHRHGKDLHHLHKWGRWLVWDGTRWAPDETAEVERRAKETVKAMFHEADPGGGLPIDRTLAGHALKTEARSRIEAMVALARSEEGIAIIPNGLDADPWALNVENGTLDLRTGKLKDHRREDLITKIAGTSYDPEAQAPTWTAFLERVLPSEPLRRFVQKLAGYSLTGDVSEQILPFLYGLGANGKSTFVTTMLAMAGEYGQQAAPDLLVMKKGSHPTELADLFGARLVASVEVEDGRRLAESLIKQLTGGERIRARYMHKDFFEFDPTHKPLLVANHRPEVRGTDHAIWRRIKLVPFDVTIPDEEKDPRLPEKLKAELPGILRWAVKGCLLWQEEGLGEPEEVRAATQGYRAEQDVLGRFIEDRCVLHERATASATDLYEAYQEWCAENGEKEESQNKFGRWLSGRELVRERDKITRRKVWKGIGLWHPDDPRGPSDREGSVTFGTSETIRNPISIKPSHEGNMNGFMEKYPKSFRNPPIGSEKVTERTGNVPSLDRPEAEADPVTAFLEDPPGWLADQLGKCREDERFIKPTCSTASYQLFGTAARWAEVEPVLRRWLGKEATA